MPLVLPAIVALKHFQAPVINALADPFTYLQIADRSSGRAGLPAQGEQGDRRRAPCRTRFKRHSRPSFLHRASNAFEFGIPAGSDSRHARHENPPVALAYSRSFTDLFPEGPNRPFLALLKGATLGCEKSGPHFSGHAKQKTSSRGWMRLCQTDWIRLKPGPSGQYQAIKDEYCLIRHC